MSSLKELTTDLQEIQEMAKDPEISADMLADTIEGLEGMFNEKAISIAHVIGNNNADIDAIDKEIERLQGRKKILNNSINHLKSYLFFGMQAANIRKITDPQYTLSIAKGREVVSVDDESKIPDEFFRVTRSVNKSAINEAIKSGAEVPGTSKTMSSETLRIR